MKIDGAYLNLGCGTTRLPGPKPPGHELVSDAVYEQPHWINIDKVASVEPDMAFDLFSYPWPLPTNIFAGALASHLVEHIPHEIRLAERTLKESEWELWYALEKLQDGWFAFFSELWRVLTPGAVVHIVCPHAHSDGAFADPTHTRYIMPHTFTHSLEVPQGQTFRYETGCSFKLAAPIVYRFTEMALPYVQIAEKQKDESALHMAMMTRLNMVYDMYAQLQVVK